MQQSWSNVPSVWVDGGWGDGSWIWRVLVEMLYRPPRLDWPCTCTKLTTTDAIRHPRLSVCAFPGQRESFTPL